MMPKNWFPLNIHSVPQLSSKLKFNDLPISEHIVALRNDQNVDVLLKTEAESKEKHGERDSKL
jgi:hypothetical protein